MVTSQFIVLFLCFAAVLVLVNILTAFSVKNQDSFVRFQSDSLQNIFSESNFSTTPLNGNLKTKRRPLIPRRFIFTSKEAKLEDLPKHIYDNVMNTIQIYRDAWNETDAPIWYINDEECKKVIQMVEPRLLPAFLEEQRGDYKADICRIAALYTTGGYYFDIDMRVLKAVPLKPTTVFASPHDVNHKGLFNSFMAVSPQHPILKNNLQVMLEYYNTTDRPFGVRETHMGTGSLKEAFERTPESERGETHMTLKELQLKGNLHPEVKRQRGVGLCNYVVRDEMDRVVYFFSRIPGAGVHCQFPANRSKGSLSKFHDLKAIRAKNRLKARQV